MSTAMSPHVRAAVVKERYRCLMKLSESRNWHEVLAADLARADENIAAEMERLTALNVVLGLEPADDATVLEP